MAKLELPENPMLASKVLDHETRKRDGGMMGYIFGMSTEKPGNIAGAVLIISFIFLACILFWGTDTQTLSKRDQVAIISGFITLTLGYVFGRTSI
jgi:hypothetical protein